MIPYRIFDYWYRYRYPAFQKRGGASQPQHPDHFPTPQTNTYLKPAGNAPPAVKLPPAPPSPSSMCQCLPVRLPAGRRELRGTEEQQAAPEDMEVQAPEDTEAQVLEDTEVQVLEDTEVPEGTEVPVPAVSGGSWIATGPMVSGAQGGPCYDKQPGLDTSSSRLCVTSVVTCGPPSSLSRFGISQCWRRGPRLRRRRRWWLWRHPASPRRGARVRPRRGICLWHGNCPGHCAGRPHPFCLHCSPGPSRCHCLG